MRSTTSRSQRLRPLILGLAMAALLFGALPAAGQPEVAVAPLDYGFQGEGPARMQDVDARPGRVAPTEEQQRIADGLGATGRWNRFGTPQTLTGHGRFLSGPQEGAPADVAREWVRQHQELFRLSDAAVDDLEVIRLSPLHESPDLGRLARGEEPLDTDVPHVVLFRQTFGDLNAAQDGLLGVGVSADGEIAHVWSSVTGHDEVSGSEVVDAVSAYRIAAGDVGVAVEAGELTLVDERTEEGFTTYRREGVADLQYVRQVALPTPTDGVRLAWETVVLEGSPSDAQPLAFIHFIDAETGEVLFRTNRVDHFGDLSGSAPVAQSSTPAGLPLPRWKVFPASPDYAGPDGEPVGDTREVWCWQPAGEGEEPCDRVIGTDGFSIFNDAARFPYDIDPDSQLPTFTTEGNQARTAISELVFVAPDTFFQRPPPQPDRNYDFEFQNQWFASSCDFTNYQRADRNFNDSFAATTNLFLMHNRMHDWGYYLGWTETNGAFQESNFGNTDPGPFPVGREEDPELGQSQAGRQSPLFTGRDNANQITLQDGISGITNQYLWQPLQAGFYAPCVDGAYDMSVVGHEVGHGIQNRMTGGPDSGLNGDQARSMGESWSDLTAIEYNNGFGFVPVGPEDPFAVGAFVTGELERGIRNYNMSESPLNFSDIEYDGNGTTSPHADGEIWSALNFDIRAALIEKYDEEFPEADQDLQTRCARGEVASQDCPGNRRWVQIMHDGFLLQPPTQSFLDARDAYLAADLLRFGGANQEELWDAFAARGMGETAATTDSEVGIAEGVLIFEREQSGADDREPTPGFSSPLRNDNAQISFAPLEFEGGGIPETMTVHVGDYEARSTPAAVAVDGEASDPMGFVPGTYDFLVTAPGYGGYRFTQTFGPGEERTLEIPLRANLASGQRGTTVTAEEGSGAAENADNLSFLVDDTESTNFAYVGEGDVRDKQVTVDLGDQAQTVREIQVSAALRPASNEDPAEEDDPPYDTGGQNRFSALRSFELLACDATAGGDCATDEDFRSVFSSADDAFPGDRPRPTAPDLTLRPFEVPEFEATHLRLRILQNQCTGGPAYQGDANPDNDTTNDPDCDEGSAFAGLSRGATSGEPDPTLDLSQAENVRIAELQVFSQPAPEIAGETDEVPEEPEIPEVPEESEAPEVPEEPDAELVVERLGGLTRVDTAIRLSQEGFDSADNVVLARSDAFPDALTASTLAAEVDGPVLLTGPNELDPKVAAEVDRLGADTVYLAGGTDALSAQVQTDLDDADLDTVRLAGANRLNTAALIAQQVVDLGGPVQTAIIARADDFTDALAAGNLATTARAPILLTATDDLPQVTVDALADTLATDQAQVTVAGGTAAVTAAVQDDLEGEGYTVNRLFGAERYATAAQFVNAAIDAGATPNPTILASGVEFPDALAAVPVSHALGGVTVLVDPADLTDSQASVDLLTANADAITTLYIAGGIEAISDAVLNQATNLLTD